MINNQTSQFNPTVLVNTFVKTNKQTKYVTTNWETLEEC